MRKLNSQRDNKMKKAFLICFTSAATALMSGCAGTSTKAADSSTNTENGITEVKALDQSITDHGFTVVWNGSEDTSKGNFLQILHCIGKHDAIIRKSCQMALAMLSIRIIRFKMLY